MRLSHTLARTSTVFDEPKSRISGVDPDRGVGGVRRAWPAGRRACPAAHRQGCERGVGGHLAGGRDGRGRGLDRRHGPAAARPDRVFAHAYAPFTLGSFLRTFTFGHVRQLDAVASRFLLALAGLTRLLGVGGEAGPGSGEYALLNVGDTIIEVHGHGKQGAEDQSSNRGTVACLTAALDPALVLCAPRSLRLTARASRADTRHCPKATGEHDRAGDPGAGTSFHVGLFGRTTSRRSSA
jgi:hypothetical protein